MGTITLRRQGNNSYYVYQETYRQKVNSTDTGKSRGSGKSQVRTRAIYLGSAEKILQCVQEKRKPMKVLARHFGLIGAAYQTAQELNLPEILKKHIPGERYGVERWIYFFVTVMNRLDEATSKNKMSGWLKKTILPELLDFDEKRLTSKHFWYVTDDIISERKVREKREETEEKDDLFVGLEDKVFTDIEKELLHQIDELISLSPSTICYDTTNFYTYIEEPKRSALAMSCHSKDSKHHLKHIGLLMAVDRVYGIPLMNRVYRANSHDSKVFSAILSELIITLKQHCSDSELTLILDKGNNKEETFAELAGKIYWIGSLVPSHYQEFIERELTDYSGLWKGKQYYRCEREVMGIKCVVLVVFNPVSQRKQEHSLARGIDKLKKEILQKWQSYKKVPTEITSGIRTLKAKSSYGKYLNLCVEQGQIHFKDKPGELEKKRQYFGKSLIFSNWLTAETGNLIDAYAGKNIIEDDFRLLKDVTLIRFRPIRHWTDTKIRAYAFCCVLAMTLMRIMQWKVEQILGYQMSPTLLKEELTDLQEIVMVYSSHQAERQISQRSTVQNKLWEVFELEKIEKQLLLH